MIVNSHFFQNNISEEMREDNKGCDKFSQLKLKFKFILSGKKSN